MFQNSASNRQLTQTCLVTDGFWVLTNGRINKTVNEKRQNFNLPNITRPTSLKENFDRLQRRLDSKGQCPKTLAFSDGLNTLVKEALETRDSNKEMQSIAKTAKFLREDMLNHEHSFTGL